MKPNPHPARASVGPAAWILLALVGALSVFLGWDRGPDPLIDFGRELYVPWRLVEGDRLHGEIAWFNGPLGPWLIEGWMRVFGVSLDALQALNATIIAAVSILLALLMKRVAGEGAAWLGGFVFLVVFAVAQQEAIGNYLFLAPYSHGITFGFAAGIAAIYCVVRAAEAASDSPPGKGTRWLVLAGSLTGAAFLTKAEIFLGTACGVAASSFALLLGSGGLRRVASGVGPLLIGFAIPLALAAARFAGQIGPDATPVALAGTWAHALREDISDMPFYRDMRGTSDLGESLQRLAFTCVGISAFLAVQYGVASAIAARYGRGRAPIAAAFGFSFAVTTLAFLKVEIEWMLIPLTVFLPIMALVSLVRWRKAIAGSQRPQGSTIALVGLSCFAAGLLPKVLFLPLARQYGFALSVPGCLLVVALLVAWIPDWLGGRGNARRGEAHGEGAPSGATGARRAAGAAVVLVFALMNANATRNRFMDRTVAFGTGGDRILSDAWRGSKLKAAYEDLQNRLEPGDELLVLPEGITLNYLLRTKTPTRLVNFMPPELVMFDESKIIETLEANPPEVVVLTHRPTDVYGIPFFGQGYGESLLEWVQEHYAVDRTIGERPFVPMAESKEKFGVSILIPNGR